MSHSYLSTARPRRWVVMGVSGCGKSEVGQRLASALDLPHIEGDSYHPPANIVKMSAGIPLDDADRSDWLLRLQSEIGAAHARAKGLVLSCSALKRRYRDLFRAADPHLVFVHLVGDRDLIASRMHARAGHYMPPSLLDSQFRDLEPLEPDEIGICLDIRKEPAKLVEELLQS